ncbi:Uncharacterized protein APZ42_021199 [Daphnia magna]|uniref:Uncharacterized protein n=1 Tax=Daphnia magna TaxID=35525 RepID=A0A164X208_9CRUS|nr:Uncharacterized protein APZ42_021199 [Daphnia magna]
MSMRREQFFENQKQSISDVENASLIRFYRFDNNCDTKNSCKAKTRLIDRRAATNEKPTIFYFHREMEINKFDAKFWQIEEIMMMATTRRPTKKFAAQAFLPLAGGTP